MSTHHGSAFVRRCLRCVSPKKPEHIVVSLRKNSVEWVSRSSAHVRCVVDIHSVRVEFMPAASCLPCLSLHSVQQCTRLNRGSLICLLSLGPLSRSENSSPQDPVRKSRCQTSLTARFSCQSHCAIPSRGLVPLVSDTARVAGGWVLVVSKETQDPPFVMCVMESSPAAGPPAPRVGVLCPASKSLADSLSLGGLASLFGAGRLSRPRL